jgi:hypothetical protein
MRDESAPSGRPFFDLREPSGSLFLGPIETRWKEVSKLPAARTGELFRAFTGGRAPAMSRDTLRELATGCSALSLGAPDGSRKRDREVRPDQAGPPNRAQR